VKTVAELSELLRARGQKVTTQRQHIFHALEGNTFHPSADQVYEAVRRDVETISLKTVYQTLNELVAMGELAALDVGTGTVRFDPNVELAHHHLVCSRCGEVCDVNMELPELSLPDAAAQGYRVSSVEVVFRGVCRRCQGGTRRRAGDGKELS
jgi:Fe2+ or Zn2+ uptake regulation protein